MPENINDLILKEAICNFLRQEWGRVLRALQPRHVYQNKGAWRHYHTFAGHDHVNAYSVDYKGVRLTYGLKSSRQFYYSEELVGGTLITLKGDTGNVSVDIEYKYVQL